ncbi:hypothetical protein AAC387_Pa05g1168 [Persea americana]
MDYYSDRSWMRRRKSSAQISAIAEFRTGCQVFLDYADMVAYHLLVKGFMNNYEDCWGADGQRRDSGITQVHYPGSSTHRMNDMVHDIAGPDFDWEQDREQVMNSDAKAFFKLLDKGSEPLWPSCTKQTTLSAVVTLLNVKGDHNMSHECFESLLKAIKMMGVPGKTKDNDKARLDVKDICKRPGLELYETPNGKIAKPHAKYTLSKKQVEDVCTWIKSLKLPYGYASKLQGVLQVGNCKG